MALFGLPSTIADDCASIGVENREKPSTLSWQYRCGECAGQRDWRTRRDAGLTGMIIAAV